MNKDELKSILEQHRLWVEGNGGKRANLRGANLRGAYLREADLQEADLQGADLQGADLQGADLQGAYLRWANLRGANLRGANLRGAYLQGANLQGANLREAELQGADLQGADLRWADFDYSCLPLWCGSAGMKFDKRLFCQIVAHLCALDVDDGECKKAQIALLPLAKQSHRAGKLGEWFVKEDEDKYAFAVEVKEGDALDEESENIRENVQRARAEEAEKDVKE